MTRYDDNKRADEVYYRCLGERISTWFETYLSEADFTKDEWLARCEGAAETTWSRELLMEECQSPIEQILGMALLFCGNGYIEAAHIAEPMSVWESSNNFDDFGLWFVQQGKVGNLTPDFLFITHLRGTRRLLAIECDGHDFHEKTKQQAARDKSRDRTLQKANCRVLRFTGSEIFRDPYSCADDVEGALAVIADDLIAIHKGNLP